MNTTQPSDDYDVIEHALQRVMWTEQKRITRLLDEHALSLPRFLVLLSIKQRGSGCPIGTLADEMLQSYPTMTGIVDRLKEAGLVVRNGDPDDRRKVVVNLTTAGRQLVDRARGARRERMIRALEHFTADDRRAFIRLLTTYLRALEEE